VKDCKQNVNKPFVYITYHLDQPFKFPASFFGRPSSEFRGNIYLIMVIQQKLTTNYTNFYVCYIYTIRFFYIGKKRKINTLESSGRPFSATLYISLLSLNPDFTGDSHITEKLCGHTLCHP
jgi:hypothetical protein